MYSSEHDSEAGGAGRALEESAGPVDEGFESSENQSGEPTDSDGDSGLQLAVAHKETAISTGVVEGVRTVRGSNARIWGVAAGFALMLIVLTIAGIYLLKIKRTNVDQITILTFPSGASITVDSKDYGHSPVKLEGFPIGSYSITIAKEGFDLVEDQITVAEPRTFEFKLKPTITIPFDLKTIDEQITLAKQSATDAFNRGHYGFPLQNSALFYLETVKSLSENENDPFVLEMRERIRKAMQQSAQTATTRGDLARAQEIYQVLVDFYPDDEEVKREASRLRDQLLSRRGDVRDLNEKGQEALEAGRILEPEGNNAYYYSKQALARDPQNQQARSILGRVKQDLLRDVDRANGQQDLDGAIRKLELFTQVFPEDKDQPRRLHDLKARREEDVARANDPVTRRQRGLQYAQRDDCQNAIPELEYAAERGQATADVIFALGRCNQKQRNLDEAARWYHQVPQGAGQTYRSSIAARGELAGLRGDKRGALVLFKQALELGGSLIYPTELLEDKIDRIERDLQGDDRPEPLKIAVRHLHGKLQGSCVGTLSVSEKGVRYDGDTGQHTFSSNVAGMNATMSKDKLTLQFPKRSEEFKVTAVDGERFRERVARYQVAINR